MIIQSKPLFGVVTLIVTIELGVLTHDMCTGRDKSPAAGPSQPQQTVAATGDDDPAELVAAGGVPYAQQETVEADTEIQAAQLAEGCAVTEPEGGQAIAIYADISSETDTPKTGPAYAAVGDSDNGTSVRTVHAQPDGAISPSSISGGTGTAAAGAAMSGSSSSGGRSSGGRSGGSASGGGGGGSASGGSGSGGGSSGSGSGTGGSPTTPDDQWDYPRRSLPSLNASFSPLAPDNQAALFGRFTAEFDNRYGDFIGRIGRQNIAADAFRFYYLRQELQALVDMWYATGEDRYLDQASRRAFKAIRDAQTNDRPLRIGGRDRGTYPCFYDQALREETNGHGQLHDFQGSAGLILVAMALRDAERTTEVAQIAGFVESQIIEKWLYRFPDVRAQDYQGPASNRSLLVALETGRDKREHMANICFALADLDFTKYPYEQWGAMLTNLYIGRRDSLSQSAPDIYGLGTLSPRDWGVITNPRTAGYVWYWMVQWRTQELEVQDTSHANRTVWLAATALDRGLITREHLQGFINTLTEHIWQPQISPFYFRNCIDGSDPQVQGMGPGLKGNVWFGWHRLAKHDVDVRNLFLMLAYDLTSGGPNVSGQNKSMAEGPLCFLAWGARLLREEVGFLPLQQAQLAQQSDGGPAGDELNDPSGEGQQE